MHSVYSIRKSNNEGYKHVRISCSVLMTIDRVFSRNNRIMEYNISCLDSDTELGYDVKIGKNFFDTDDIGIISRIIYDKHTDFAVKFRYENRQVLNSRIIEILSSVFFSDVSEYIRILLSYDLSPLEFNNMIHKLVDREMSVEGVNENTIISQAECLLVVAMSMVRHIEEEFIQIDDVDELEFGMSGIFMAVQVIKTATLIS